MAAAAASVLTEASEKVLKQVYGLYEVGLASSKTPGSIGLKAIADHPALGLSKQVRKPRKQISVMMVGNHSAGKSSFINWYIGEQVCRTGVAIETRGFIFVTHGKKRETLTGDATIRYFEHLKDFAHFEGILPNLFTEVSTSTEHSFTAVDFVDTPGLVDGDMKYPFNVRDAILWMADHVDLILVFFDPIGQATCKRTMEVVERLNQGPHVEKILYFMSKADEVERESDRQRVLIQITQNLATRIRNSHAFNLPTLYLPHEDELPCHIPNAIDEVCDSINLAINQTVQKVLRQLREDCAAVSGAVVAALQRDGQHRAGNVSGVAWGVLLLLVALMAVLGSALLLAGRVGGLVCPMVERTAVDVCQGGALAALQQRVDALGDSFGHVLAVCIAAALVLAGASQVAWRQKPVLSRADRRRLEGYGAYVHAIAAQGEALWEEYFKTLAHAGAR